MISDQASFAAALLDPEQPCPAGLIAWNGSDPAHRFRIYRNNVIVSLIDALADSFAVTSELVGEEFFREMARRYATARPPQSPQLAFYGADFPDFIESFPPARGLPYLADVARLEYRRIVAYHAADVAAVGPEQIAAALGDEAGLPALALSLHPSLSVLASSSAVVSLWAAHQGIRDLATVRPEQSETALILRRGLEVEVIQISAAAGAFIAALQSGASLGAAAAIDDSLDLAATLALLLQKSAITALHSPRREA